MNNRVIYATMTRHSKKIALDIGNAFNLQVDNVKDQPILSDVDLLFIVGGIYGGESLPPLLTYVKELDNKKVKKVALITSSAMGKQRQTEVTRILQEKQIKVLDELLCHGSFLFIKMGRPNKADRLEALDFAG